MSDMASELDAPGDLEVEEAGGDESSDVDIDVAEGTCGVCDQEFGAPDEARLPSKHVG